MDEFARLDATAQAALVRQGQAQPLELVDAAIGRIEQRNPSLNAVIISLFEQARAQAQSPSLPEGLYGREDILIRVAAQLEEAQPWSDRWPSPI